MSAGAPARVTRRSIRVFAAPARQARVRRATDVVVLVPSLLVLGLAIALYPPSTTEVALERLLDDLPHWLDPVWAFAYDLLWLWAAVLFVAAVVNRRLVVVAQALASLVLAAALALLAARLALGFWPTALDAVLGRGDAPRFPNVRVAASTAVIMAVSPHIVGPLRSIGRRTLAFGVVGASVVGGSTPLGTLTAVLIALAAAAIVNFATCLHSSRTGPCTRCSSRPAT